MVPGLSNSNGTPDLTIVGTIQNGFLGRMARYSPKSVVVWLALAKRADKTCRCYPSITTLQRDTGLARATIYGAIKELENSGEILVTSGGGKGNPSNHYQITGGPGNELVQSVNQFNPQTKVVQSVYKGGPPIELKPYPLTKPKNQTKARTKFVSPSIEEIQAYCQERGNKVDPQRFLDYYESNGWKVGRNAMKDWKAAIRTWERNGFSNTSGTKDEKRKRYAKGCDRF